MTDPFSEIVRFTKAETLLTGGFTAGGAWAVRFPVPEKIKFFVVLKGGCWVTIDGEEPMRFDTGDVGLLNAKRTSILASDLATPPLDAMRVFANGVRHLGVGEDFAHMGGHVALDPVSGRLLAEALPPWIHIRAASREAAAFRVLLEQLVAEQTSPLPGASLAAAQLAQLLFIQVLRVHLQTSTAMPPGWLRTLGDPRIAPALRLMHETPGRDWKLEDLAKACAMSRTTFALRFKEVAGVAPLTYLTDWRMCLAERALREEKRSVAAIAESLGYNSESAFSHAFKRVKGISPKSCRELSA